MADEPATSTACPDQEQGFYCYACGWVHVAYKKCKVFCARCGQLLANCCGD